MIEPEKGGFKIKNTPHFYPEHINMIKTEYMDNNILG